MTSGGRTNYREELLGDVVHALFDKDRDGYIDRKSACCFVVAVVVAVIIINIVYIY